MGVEDRDNGDEHKRPSWETKLIYNLETSRKKITKHSLDRSSGAAGAQTARQA